MMETILSLIVFVVMTFAGYKLIKNVPSLLHTPLMSGMNALSGISLLAALSATAFAAAFSSRILGIIAVACAMVNVVAGFGVTSKMLKMFKKSDGEEGGK